MAKSPYFVNEVYGLGYWLKDYGFYPKSWPLYTYMDHGTTMFDKIPPHEIENDAPLIFKFSPRLVAEYKKVSDKPVYNLMNPTIHCRQKNKIEIAQDAKGTLFFPGHSTDYIDDDTKWDLFIEDLKTVPEKFKPLDICLHPTDVKKGVDKIFEAKDYRVISAGSAYSDEFAGNFYRILRNYRFTMSNLLGSYLFYSVEMGMPFSLFGAAPKFVNKGDKNIEAGAYTSYRDQPTYQKAISLFNGFHTEISAEQAAFINFELGKNSSISRPKASFLLYKALFIHLLRTLKLKIYRMPILSGLKQRIRILRYKRMLHHKKDSEYELIRKNFITLEELLRLKSVKGVKTSTLLGREVEITDTFWYQHSLKEIFAEDIYKFRPANESPYILDCGSNIGLSVIYFKRLFPKARVVAFEPDVRICSVLTNNLKAFGYDDVDIRNKAIWNAETELNFSSTGDLGGRLQDSAGETSGGETIRVQTVRLRDYLNQEVDFLKLDIEGPEVEVLEDCSDLLHNVQHLFVEYHGDAGKEQELDKLLGILKGAGFRVYIKEAWNNLPFPFLRNDYKPWYDLQLNIFAYRS